VEYAEQGQHKKMGKDLAKEKRILVGDCPFWVNRTIQQFDNFNTCHTEHMLSILLDCVV
jgi:hypothetical protein